MRVRVVRQEAGRVGEVRGGVAREEGEEAVRVGGEAKADELRMVLPQLHDGVKRDGSRGRVGAVAVIARAQEEAQRQPRRNKDKGK
jgi:hypothetical protein